MRGVRTAATQRLAVRPAMPLETRVTWACNWASAAFTRSRGELVGDQPLALRLRWR